MDYVYKRNEMNDFLPITKEDIKRRGWERPDFVYVIGDAYVDHSSFGPAIISRVLESRGYKVAIISQPDYHDENSITVFGEPRLGFLVSAGNMDSMVNRYTVNKKPRSEDAYTPGGKAGKRPDYATTVYCNLINRKYKHVPVIVGGVEASLRRLAHYDYWSDKFKRSILMDCGADLLMYGMGELSIVEIADALNSGISISNITFVRGTVYKSRDISGIVDAIELPDYDVMRNDRLQFAKSFNIQYQNTDPVTAKPLIEKYGEKRYIVQNPPQRPLTTQEMDDVYELPYMNAYHPSYEKLGGVPALKEVKFSLTSNRGCFGCCSFCAITMHQGRIVQARSHGSLIREAEAMTHDPEFKGYIHDVGGPTADFRGPACDKQLCKGACKDRQCLFPKPCKNLKRGHEDYLSLLRKLRNIDGVKKVFIRSGIRFDYVLEDGNDRFIEEICRNHISGQLRLAPEHVSDNVLRLMGKPTAEVYEKFLIKVSRINERLGLRQYVVPYLISSHPGSTLDDAIALAEAVRDMGYMPEQVQDFYPTPSTISTCMYYTGVDPRTMEKVYVPSDPREKHMQRALIQYQKPENYRLVREALLKAGREDLIGNDRNKCLILPYEIRKRNTGTVRKNVKDLKYADSKGNKDSQDNNGNKDIRDNKGVKNKKSSNAGSVSSKISHKTIKAGANKIGTNKINTNKISTNKISTNKTSGTVYKNNDKRKK